NNKYRGVYFTKFRPKFTTDYFITDTSQKNEYFKKTIYWFKYEPITWTVKEELKGCATIVCDMILDSQDFNYTTNNKTINGKSIYANNYQHSHIRSWLNDMFYNTAFNKLEQELIQITTVDNSLLSTEYLENKYICNDTNDKIYLLSKKELTTYFEDNLQRQKQSSDYAKCQGLTGCWWLRSPSYYNSYNTLSIGSNGNITNGSYVSFSSSGVLPVLRIKL
ncbi:MAG: hypothetical protein IJW82_03095, partial [Clostridia bacterium]|nr:hypothetical protein [Clostridia bacterium]